MVEKNEKKFFDLNETRYSGIFGVAHYESEVKILKFLIMGEG